MNEIAKRLAAAMKEHRLRGNPDVWNQTVTWLVYSLFPLISLADNPINRDEFVESEKLRDQFIADCGGLFR